MFRAFWTHSSQVKCVKGGDGHPWLLWRHKNLMLLFFRSVYRVLSDTGRICVSTGIRSWSRASEGRAQRFEVAAVGQTREWLKVKSRRRESTLRDRPLRLR